MKSSSTSTKKHPKKPAGYAEKKYRVFISYSRDDRKWVEIIDAALREIALPMWDKDFRFGHGFHEQIQMFIAHSHVFLPVITDKSSQRGWVHQEIGYAKSLNIPVLPITLGDKALPDAMIQALQAVRLDGDETRWEAQLQESLTIEVLENLISDFTDQEHAHFQCAEDTGDRARLLVSYSDSIRKLGYHGLVRQAGALTSFHIPSETINHPVWRDRYGNFQRSENHCRLQREERQALEKHARENGCRLIITPGLDYERYGLEARVVRLKCLLKFLQSMPSNKVQVAFDRTNLYEKRSLTIVGNWFTAESVHSVIGQGYSQTIFTRHAPSVQRKIDLFEEEFGEMLETCKWKPSESCRLAIEELKKLIAELGQRNEGEQSSKRQTK